MPTAAADVLESQERVGRTSADETPLRIYAVATLKTGEDEEQFEDAISKTSYRPTQKDLRVSHRDETSLNQPVTLIECAATPEGPLARIVQCPANKTIQLSCVKKNPNCLETSVWFDECAAGTPRSPARYSFDQRESRARIISRDDKMVQKLIEPATTISGERIKTNPSRQQTSSERSKSAPYRKPKSKAIKCTRQPDPDVVISLSSRMGVAPIPRAARRNGLDPAELPESSKRSLGGRVCSTARHQPTEDSTTLRSPAKEVREDSFTIETRLTTDVRPDDQRGLRQPTSEQMLGAEVTPLESAKLNKASAACRRSAAASGRVRLIPRRVPDDTSRSLGSQEPLARHELYIPEYQLERYAACRSKRNGLQDECVTPFLRAVSAKMEEQRKGTWEKCIERERSIVKLDRAGTREPACAHRDKGLKIAFYLG